MYHNFKVYNDSCESLYICIKMKNDAKLVDLFYTNTLNKTVWIDSTKTVDINYKLMSFQTFEKILSYEGLFVNTDFNQYLHYDKLPLL